MTKVQVVNAQSIDGRKYKRDEVAEFPEGRARDLIYAGKVRPVQDAPKPAAENKGAKNG